MKGENDPLPYHGHLLQNFCPQEYRQEGHVHSHKATELSAVPT